MSNTMKKGMLFIIPLLLAAAAFFICAFKADLVRNPDTGPEETFFSKDSGIYDRKSMKVRIENAVHYPVYYTTDGSIPDENSEKADGAVLITAEDTNRDFIDRLNQEMVGGFHVLQSAELPKATVIRAAALRA